MNTIKKLNFNEFFLAVTWHYNDKKTFYNLVQSTIQGSKINACAGKLTSYFRA